MMAFLKNEALIKLIKVTAEKTGVECVFLHNSANFMLFVS